MTTTVGVIELMEKARNESYNDALEAAAQLVIRQTRVPLGTKDAMNDPRVVLGEQLAFNIRRMRVRI